MAEVTVAKPLIRFDGTKLILVENHLPTTPLKILSIIGKARMGKSSFLNAFISKYTGKNTTVFTTQDGDDHCTLGIDYYYIAEHNLLLLDSQGLAHENSSHDPSLLLFIYLVSNIIIFNESSMLQNSALRLIEPICTFTQYLDMETLEKPSLVFRISDAKRGSDINKTLEKLMAHHNDQYNSIRESIENVFAQPVKIIKTEYPQSEEDVLLSGNDYLGLLMLKENGFDTAITSLIADICSSSIRSDILQNLSSYIDSINNNEQININKLDIVSLTHNNDILTWLNKVPAELKSEIEVDGTQECYEKNVVSRQALVKKWKTDFTKRFKNITDTIKKEHKAKFDSELDRPIERAKEKSEKLALESLEKYGLKSLMEPHDTGIIHDAGLTDNDKELVSTYLGPYQRFQSAFAHVYEPIRLMYDKIINSMFKELSENVDKARENSLRQRALVQEMSKAILDEFDAWLVERIDALTLQSIVLEKAEDVYKKYRDMKVAEFEAFIHKTVIKQNVKLAIISGKKLGATVQNSDLSINMKYELIDDIYSEFRSKLNELPDHEVRSFLIQKKEDALKNRLIMDPVLSRKIQLINSDITFVHDRNLLGNCVEYEHSSGISQNKNPYMTYHTWLETYVPIYEKAMETLKKDGICSEKMSFHDFIVQSKDANILTVGSKKDTLYEENIEDIMCEEMRKEFCRMTVRGFDFPTVFLSP